MRPEVLQRAERYLKYGHVVKSFVLQTWSMCRYIDPMVMSTSKNLSANLSIGKVSKLTGLTPDTIRVWERRHSAVSPARTEGGSRRYSAADVSRLRLLSRAIEAGNAIGTVAKLNNAAIEMLLDPMTRQDASPRMTKKPDPFEHVVEEYLNLIQRMALTDAQNLLRRTALILSTRDLVFGVLLPILRDVGHRWERSDFGVHHEHVVSTHVRSLLAIVGIDQMVTGRERIIVTTPSGHYHEFGALLSCFLIGAQGQEPLYLGPNMPARDIAEAAGAAGANHVVLSIIPHVGSREMQRLLDDLELLSKSVTLWCGMPPSHPLAARINEKGIDVRVLHSLHELDAVDWSKHGVS